MSNQPTAPRRKVFSSQHLPAGEQKVVLNDAFLVENNKTMQMESIFIRTIQNAEMAAAEIVENARQEAQLILTAAQEKAAQILKEEGEDQRDAVLNQAYEEGYRAGLEKGYGQIAEELSEKLLMADTIVQKSFEAQAILIDQHRHQLLEVINTIIKLVLPYEISSTPKQLTGLLEKAAESIYFTGQARIRLHPETLQSLQAFSPEFAESLQKLEKITFISDMNCQPLEMILESAESSVLISPESQAEVYLNYLEKNLQFEEGDPDLLEATALIAELQTHDPNAPEALPEFVSGDNPRQVAPEEPVTEPEAEAESDMLLDEAADEEPAPQEAVKPDVDPLLQYLDNLEQGQTDIPE